MEDEISPLWGGIVFAIFILINGILYAYGAAIQNVSEGDIERLADDGDKPSISILKMLENPGTLINTIQIVTTLLSVLAGYIGVTSFIHIFRIWLATLFVNAGFSNILVNGVLLFFVVCTSLFILIGFGVLAPKKIGNHFAKATIYNFYGTIRLIIVLFSPLTFTISKFSNLIVRIFGIDPNQKMDVTEEEIISIVDEAHEQGLILESEAEMIQNIIQFSDKDAKDIMTHRKNINGLDGQITLDDAIKIMLDESNSRYPVYLGDIDNIIGIIHLKDAMKQVTYHKNGHLALQAIPDLIRNVAFVPETRSIDGIFKLMQQKKVQMVIIIDEYGQTSGLVAMEDILEEIVGNILDEYDDEVSFIHPLHDNSVLMDGLTPLEEVGAELNVDFSEEEFETLNGYLTSLLEHIPSNTDKLVIGKGYLFDILLVENNIIKKVRVEKLQEEKGETTCQDIQNSQT